jgi:hypothetical protein
MQGPKIQELIGQVKTVLGGRAPGLIDSAIPMLVYLGGNNFLNPNLSILVATGTSIALSIYRTQKGQSISYSLGGLVGTLVAAGFVLLSGQQSGFFVPGMVTNLVIALLCLLSIALRTPLVALTSSLVRRWPLGWFRHPLVLPAYSEVTWLWAGAFFVRLLVEYKLFNSGSLGALGFVQAVVSLPFTIGLLIVSYIFGQWRLRNLHGPSVKEYETGATPPWTGQTIGF